LQLFILSFERNRRFTSCALHAHVRSTFTLFRRLRYFEERDIFSALNAVRKSELQIVQSAEELFILLRHALIYVAILQL
jgi:hypothetical protein